MILLEAFSDIADPVSGLSSLDESLRVAAGLVRTMLPGSRQRTGCSSKGLYTSCPTLARTRLRHCLLS